MSSPLQHPFSFHSDAIGDSDICVGDALVPPPPPRRKSSVRRLGGGVGVTFSRTQSFETCCNPDGVVEVNNTEAVPLLLGIRRAEGLPEGVWICTVSAEGGSDFSSAPMRSEGGACEWREWVQLPPPPCTARVAVRAEGRAAGGWDGVLRLPAHESQPAALQRSVCLKGPGSVSLLFDCAKAPSTQGTRGFGALLDELMAAVAADEAAPHPRGNTLRTLSGIEPQESPLSDDAAPPHATFPVSCFTPGTASLPPHRSVPPTSHVGTPAQHSMGIQSIPAQATTPVVLEDYGEEATLRRRVRQLRRKCRSDRRREQDLLAAVRAATSVSPPPFPPRRSAS
eukprot:Hpha_TRINITY_DN2254_c0_g1::TRINITY_DN2254_c0_g1_i1::g.25449::m.25449